MKKKLVFKDAKRHFDVVRAAMTPAAKLIMKHYGKIQQANAEAKALNDFVTFVDRGSQEILINKLKKTFPDYGFKAEEEGVDDPAARTWVIDPIDGTSNFIHQIPSFCISVSLKEKGRHVLGMVFDPYHNECFYAARGFGAFLNKKPIRVSKTAKLGDAFLATGFPFRSKARFDAYQESFKRIVSSSSGLRRCGSAALDVCYTACGRFDGFWEIGLKEWDVAAGSVVLEEAGGIITDFHGDDNGFTVSGDTVTGNPDIHRQLLKILKTIPQLYNRD